MTERIQARRYMIFISRITPKFVIYKLVVLTYYTTLEKNYLSGNLLFIHNSKSVEIIIEFRYNKLYF